MVTPQKTSELEFGSPMPQKAAVSERERKRETMRGTTGEREKKDLSGNHTSTARRAGTPLCETSTVRTWRRESDFDRAVARKPAQFLPDALYGERLAVPRLVGSGGVEFPWLSGVTSCNRHFAVRATRSQPLRKGRPKEPFTPFLSIMFKDIGQIELYVGKSPNSFWEKRS